MNVVSNRNSALDGIGINQSSAEKKSTLFTIPTGDGNVYSSTYAVSVFSFNQPKGIAVIVFINAELMNFC